MIGDHCVVIGVAYDRRPAYGRFLEWIAPELRDAGLTMTEDHSDEANASRTWPGVVDGATFARFADARRLDAKPHDRTLILATEAGDLDMRAYTSIRRDELGGQRGIVHRLCVAAGWCRERSAGTWGS